MTNRKPRLFSFGRETELANLDAWVQDAEQRALLVEVVDAFIDVSRTRKVSAETLRPILVAAGHPAATVRALAMGRLVVMAHYFDEAREALGTLATHQDEGVRLFLTSSLANAPEVSQQGLLPVLIADAEWSVRKAAAQVCGSVNLSEPLNARRDVEDDARVKIAIELALKRISAT